VDAAARHLDVSGSRVADGGRGEGRRPPVQVEKVQVEKVQVEKRRATTWSSRRSIPKRCCSS
jgi:hypothetical protein